MILNNNLKENMNFYIKCDVNYRKLSMIRSFLLDFIIRIKISTEYLMI